MTAAGPAASRIESTSKVVRGRVRGWEEFRFRWRSVQRAPASTLVCWLSVHRVTSGFVSANEGLQGNAKASGNSFHWPVDELQHHACGEDMTPYPG